MCKSPGGGGSLRNNSSYSFLAGSPKDVLPPAPCLKFSQLDAVSRTYQKLVQSSGQNLISFNNPEPKTFLDNLASRPPINYNSPIRAGPVHTRTGSGCSNGSSMANGTLSNLTASNGCYLTQEDEICDNCRICVRHRKISIQSGTSSGGSGGSDDSSTVVTNGSSGGGSIITTVAGKNKLKSSHHHHNHHPLPPKSIPPMSFSPSVSICDEKSPEEIYGIPSAEEILDDLRKGALVEDEVSLYKDSLDYGLVIRGSGPAFIQSIDPAGPARRVGLKTRQVIVSINRQNVLHMCYRDVCAKLNANPYARLSVLTLPPKEEAGKLP